MRFCTWNIWAPGSKLRERHWVHCAGQLREWNIDIAALQEVDRRWGERTSFADVAADMAHELRVDHVLFGASIQEEDRGYGNAILSRWPILQDGLVHLSPGAQWVRGDHQTEPRTALWALIDAPQGPVIVVSTHLANAPHFASTPITREQAANLARLAADLHRQFPGIPRIIAGDFNLEPHNEEIRQLERVLLRRSSGAPTWPVQPFSYKGWEEQPPPRFCVDHLFSDLPLLVAPQDSDLSDHLPLTAAI